VKEEAENGPNWLLKNGQNYVALFAFNLGFVKYFTAFLRALLIF